MAINNILPFCPTDTGTNLLTQGDYAVAADRTSGNQPGVASSKLNNKAIRQSTFIASQLAQFISDKTGNAVLDDGDTAALLAIMVSAFAEPTQSYNVQNLGITTSVATSALTIAMKTSTGADASAASPVKIGFRSATAGTGQFTTQSVIAALSLVISSGSTLGTVSGVASSLYVYAIYTGAAVVLGVSGSLYDDGSIQSTTAEGGAGAADSGSIIYTTAAQTNKPIRLIGRMLSTQTTAGTWATNMSEISLLPFVTSANPNVRPVVSTDTAVTSDGTLLLSGASFTQTLFTAVGNKGKTITLIHGGTSLTQVYTLATTAAQTIGGIASGSYALYTNGEVLVVQSDGANWQIIEHKTKTGTISAGAVVLGATTTPPVVGTVDNNVMYWERDGKYADITWVFSRTSVAGGATAGSGDYKVPMPTGMQINTAAPIIAYNTSPGVTGSIALMLSSVGDTGQGYVNATVQTRYYASVFDADFFRMFVDNLFTGVAIMGSGSNALNTNNTGFRVKFRFPIVGWQP